jgi:tRNA A-37 threonylcarbamoyl transferase component Bud32
MDPDLTELDPRAWEAMKRALNQRVVVSKSWLIPSKRNRVWVVETDVRSVVVKKSLSHRAPQEFEALLKARGKGIDVPIPMFMHGDFVVMEYIPGEPCESLINLMFSAEVAERLGVWLASFHEAFSDGEESVMADAVLSNFVLHDGRIYGFDLEDVRPGEPLDDVGMLATSILATEPYFTPIKFDLCRRMLEAYEEVAGTEVIESSRPYVARHLRLACHGRPLLRRPFEQAAQGIGRAWPKLA